jgi:hypothetical protein
VNAPGGLAAWQPVEAFATTPGTAAPHRNSMAGLGYPAPSNAALPIAATSRVRAAAGPDAGTDVREGSPSVCREPNARSLGSQPLDASVDRGAHRHCQKAPSPSAGTRSRDDTATGGPSFRVTAKTWGAANRQGIIHRLPSP